MNRSRALVPLSVIVIIALAMWARSRLSESRFPGRASPDSTSAFETFEEEVMATVLRVTLPRGPEARAAADSVFRAFNEVDDRMSEWKSSSPLSEVNRKAGVAPVPVPADLRALVRRGMKIGDLTGGAFDITWAALWGLWDFKAPQPQVPPAEEIRNRVALVDYRRVQVDDDKGTVFLPRVGMKIGLGGIAKGYALDRAAASLRRLGVEDFLILGGGQVMAGGKRGSRLWRVGVRDPRGDPSDVFATLQVSDVSTSTSGDYERYFIRNGKRYHHILDPRTGMPSEGLRSVTVVCADATLADALSTAIMVMGKKKGLALVDRLPGVEAVLVDDQGKVTVTDGLADRIRIVHPPRKAEL